MDTPRHRLLLEIARGTVPPASLYERVRSQVDRTSSPRTRTRSRIVAALLAIAVLTGAVVLIASEVVYQRPAMGLEVAGQPTFRLIFVLSLLTALTFATTLVAVWRGNDGFGAGARSLMIFAAFAAPVYAGLVLPSPIHAHDLQSAALPISPWGVRCFAIAMIVGTLALASFGAALRRAVPAASHIRGMAVGAAAAAWAGMAVFLFCPSGEQQHLFVGHVLPMVGHILIGGLALPRLLRP